MSFERARSIADAVLLEGYVLYPYRSTSRKNQYRWTFGVLAPRAWTEAGGCEPWWLQTECLLTPRSGTRIEGRLRFMQVCRRPSSVFADRSVVEQDQTRVATSWDEGELREIDFDLMIPDGVDRIERRVPYLIDAQGETKDEPISPADHGKAAGDRRSIRGQVLLVAERVVAPRDLVRVRVRVENVTAWSELDAPREEALTASCVSTHVLLQVENGSFLSALSPPDWAKEASSACDNVRTYPVLAGPEGEDDLLLAAPIVLYDHPRIAPESTGDFHDATEIDEMLALRTLLLTDEEKASARATDPRAAAIVDRVESMPPEALDRLHGAIRELRANEMIPRRHRGGAAFSSALSTGMRVRLRPGARRTDAQDLLYAGQTAIIEKVLEDVDGRQCFAVTIEGDPAADLHRWYGRFHYYYADEIEPLVTGGGGDA